MIRPFTGSSGARGPRRWLVRLRDRLRARPDSEHVMSLNRVVFCVALGSHLAFSTPDRAWDAALVAGLGLVITACLFAHVLLGPARCIRRQVLAMVADMSVIGTTMHLGGDQMSCWYPVILWMILGNGFRLGRRNLLRATAVGAVGFGAVAVTTPFWLEHPTLAAGLLLGIVTLPLYTHALLARLNAAKRQAEQANQAKSLFLANVSHELRTPLHAIVGLGSLLEQAKLPPEPADMARTIMSASRSLLELIDDVLKLSHAEAGGTPAAEVEFELPVLLGDVRDMVRTRAREKGLQLAVHVGAGVPARIRGAERQIREVLVNLAGNALKFTERGGILLAVGFAGSPAGADPPKTRLRFEVVDTGIGIAPEAHQRIFEKFTQADRSITERFGGTGLGLAICKRVVGLLGGDIGVESRPGQGSTFWFEIDCVALPGAATGAAQGPARSPAAASPAPAAGTLAAISIGVGVHPSVRAAVRALDPETVITECGGVAAVQSQLASAAVARRTVLADVGDPTAAAVLDAAVRAMGRPDVPFMLLVGDPAGSRPGPDLRWIAPTWIPCDVTEASLRAALTMAGALRGTAGPYLAEADAPPAAESVPGDPVLGDRAPSGSATDPSTDAAASDGQAAGDLAAGGDRVLRIRTSRTLSILVVDDNRTNQKVVTKIVESGGHSCRVAGDGEAALDMLEAGGFDLVLMDVNMPVLDGLETTRLHRVASLGMPRLPILALTADASPDMAQRCADAGMDGCITKPVRAADLLAAIERAVPAMVPASKAAGTGRPALRVVQAPQFDAQLLDGLRDVGGDAFVSELLDGFLADAGQLLQRMEGALGRDDTVTFQADAHALASAAGNLGATRVSQLGLALERMRAGEIGLHGRRKLRELSQEIDGFAVACSADRRRSQA